MLEARPAAMAPRVNGFRDADGRLSMNAHQWLGIGAYASLVLGFYLLQAPAVGNSTTRLALEICYGAVALVDGNAMFNRPGPRLVDAFRWLVAWINDRPGLTPPDFPVRLPAASAPEA